MQSRWVDKTPPKPFHPIAMLAGITIILGLALIAFAPFAAANPPPPNTNQVEYWCPNGGVKLEPVSTPFVVPAPPEGRTWTLLVLKAGNDETSTVEENELFANPTPGQSYVRADGKAISHAILCQSTLATTTVPTTIATTTTAQCPEEPCVPDTQVITTTTVATTTIPTTIATTTTAGTTTTTCPDCVPVTFGTTTTLPVCTTCRQVDPTTTAPTVTVPFTVAPTTSVPSTVSTVTPVTSTVAAPTTVPAVPPKLPVTGGSPWWLALFGGCLVALGLLAVAWVRVS